MPSSDLKRLVHNLQEADPARDSLNVRFQITARRTGLEKLIGRLIYILTFTLRAKNPQLDLVARKAATLADEIFKEPVTGEEQTKLVRAFSNFLDILARNDGSEGKRIRNVVDRIQAMRPVDVQPALKPLAFQIAPPPPVALQAVPVLQHPQIVQAVIQPPVAAAIPQKALGGPVAPVKIATPPPKLESNTDLILNALFSAKDQAAFNSIILPYGGCPQGDILFKDILSKMKTAPDRTLLMMVAAPLRPEQAKLLVDALLASHRSLLARHIDLLHSNNRYLTAEQAFDLLKGLGNLQQPVLQPILRTYAAFLGGYPSILELFKQPMPVVQALFNTGNMAFQVQVAWVLILRNQLRAPDSLDENDLTPFYSAAPEVWAKAGDKLLLETELYDFKDLFEKKLSDAALIAFINRLAARPAAPKDSRRVSLLRLYKFLLERAEMTYDATPIFSLTAQAFSFIDRCACKPILLLRLLKDPGSPVQEKLLCDLIGSVINQKTNATLLPDLLGAISSEQIQQLTWSNYPRWLAFLFALKSGKLSDHAKRLKAECFELDAEETEKILTIYPQMYLPLLEVILALIEPRTSTQAPLVQSLIIEKLNKGKNSDQDWKGINSIMLSNLNYLKVTSPSARQFLLKNLEIEDIQSALTQWNLHVKLVCTDQERALFSENYPAARIIEAVEDPDQLAAFVFTAIGFEQGSWLASHLDDPVIEDIFSQLESCPWKLRAALLRGWKSFKLDRQTLNQWSAGRKKYPKCFEILDQCQRACDFTKVLNNILWPPGSKPSPISSPAVSDAGWTRALEHLQNADESINDFLLAHLREASPRGIALSFQISKNNVGEWLAALLDKQCRTNIHKALAMDVVPIAAYLQIDHFMEQMAKSSFLPLDAKNQVAEFAATLARYRSIGGKNCCLQKQYLNPDFSDITIRVEDFMNGGYDTYPAHRALLLLDPFCKGFVGPNRVVNCNDAILKPLQRLYGVLEPGKLAADNRKFSLEALKNPPAGPGIVAIQVDGIEIRAHAFILASSLPFVEAGYLSGKIKQTDKFLKISYLNASQVRDVVEWVYTGQVPRFPDESSKNAFGDALNYFFRTE